MGARLTALTKPDGGVRGIATGSSLRRLVARILARQFMGAFEKECAPFQYALSTKAGTDCVGHLLRASTVGDPTSTVLSFGAYDHVLRSAMLGRLLQMPPVTRGWMARGNSALSRKPKEESKEIRSCRCSSPLAFKVRLRKWPHPLLLRNTCALSWMTCLLCPPERVVPYKLLTQRDVGQGGSRDKVAPREDQGVEQGR